ncbi:histidinol-phosphatase HisJ [Halobacillus sp. Cin3]|uniref:histidinol-phosphatase HisJ n=1 Tax=Halobacillus sp. Cin3 TaxID=2928441 RepID=UPI00248E4CEC|nr:histidinol-phosphatase HisJ [Halobacillus sp. Cin3]
MKDGHIHTPYCPHGSKDSLESYIENAIKAGYSALTFTEHAPLPDSFTDPAPAKDSSMTIEDLENYLADLGGLQKKYEKDLTILKGLEVDYIEGYEKETASFLDTYGPELDDSILSVHFLKGNKAWYCIDYSPEMFEEAAADFGSIETLYRAYYDVLAESVQAPLGSYKPKRIGHMTLVRKFQRLYPGPEEWSSRASHFLTLVREHGFELDYNGAGMKKNHCKETYPPLAIAREASSMGIPLIYGSDAHTASALKQGWEAVDHSLIKPWPR